MHIQDSFKQQKIDSLESIRGIAALIVVLYHIPSWNGFLHQIPLIRGGGVMVDLFFVLSGYVIFTAYGQKLNDARSFFKFQFLRFGRLYPVHLLFLLVALGIETLKYVLQAYYGIESHSKAPFEQNDLSAFLREIFLIKAFWPNEIAMSFNSPAWSISAEFYTYVLFGLILLFARTYKLIIFVTIALVAIYVLFAYDPEQYNFMLRCWAGFFVGCITAQVEKSSQHRLNNHQNLLAWLIPIVFVAIYLIAINHKGYTGIALLTYPVSGLLILCIVLGGNNLFTKLLTHRLLVWLGTLSYSLYMCHGAVLWGFQQFLRLAFDRPELMIEGISAPQFTSPVAVILVLVFLAITFVIAQFTYHFIEKPFRIKSRNFINNK